MNWKKKPGSTTNNSKTKQLIVHHTGADGPYTPITTNFGKEEKAAFTTASVIPYSKIPGKLTAWHPKPRSHFLSFISCERF
jgi:hypothetical protein